jgi:uncharacterized membrane protein HdeD (DUF308 family)
MDTFFRNWNFFRILRLLGGVAIFLYGYTEMDWLLMMIGVTFSVMAIANTACGPFSSDCKVDYKEKEGHESN